LSIYKDRQINQQSKEIKKLKEECEELKNRVDALEKRAVGNAGAGSGSYAHTGDATRKKES
jgi:predicted RNase H-like nuclease (RuvC/YqgF family)